MSTDPKKSASAAGAAAARAEFEKGIRIFTYPKIVFLYPTMIVSFLCAIIMFTIKNRELTVPRGGPGSVKQAPVQAAPNTVPPTTKALADEAPPRRSATIQNLAGLLFLGVFFFNIIVMSLDFPRFTIFAGILFGAAAGFLLLWLSTFFSLMPAFLGIVEYLYPVANHQFYLLVALTLMLCYGAVFITRYLDYWVITPNEILHNHGPFSDLERLPDLQPQIRQGNPRHPRIRLTRLRQTGASRRQRTNGVRPRKRAVHQPQGTRTQANDVQHGSPRHRRQESARALIGAGEKQAEGSNSPQRHRGREEGDSRDLGFKILYLNRL